MSIQITFLTSIYIKTAMSSYTTEAAVLVWFSLPYICKLFKNFPNYMSTISFQHLTSVLQ
jgi:hypothetical protein